MLGPGKHRVVVQNAGFVGSGADGRPQLSIYFVDDVGEGIAWYHSLGVLKDGGFSQASCDFACDQLRALGWDANERGFAFEELGEQNSPIVGREAEIVVVSDTFDGKTHTKVKYINDPNRPRAGAERMAPEQATSFLDRVRSELRKAGKAVPQASAPRPVPASASPKAPPINQPLDNYDDIPF